MDDLEVGAMLCSLMCHDLVSPVGALANGVEILEEEDDKKIQEQALGLLSLSADEASCRLQFFRLAFGSSGGLGAQLNLDDAKRVLAGLFQHGKIRLSWNAPGRSLDKTVVKLLLNLVFVGAGSLGRGGTVDVNVGVVDGADPAHPHVVIAVAMCGENAGLKENCRGLLTGETDPAELTTRTVQPYYTWRLSQKIGGNIEVDDRSENNISITATIPGIG